MIDQNRARMITMRQEIEEEYSVWYKDVTRLPALLGTSISAPRTPRLSRQMQNANAPSTSPPELYLHILAIPFCDHLSTEFHNPFNPESMKGREIRALLPGIITETGNVHIVDGLMFWESDMPKVSSLLAEVKEWQRRWRTTEHTQSSFSSKLADCLQHADEDIFPNFRTLLTIGCTLVILPFSCLRRVKTYLRKRLDFYQSGYVLNRLRTGKFESVLMRYRLTESKITDLWTLLTMDQHFNCCWHTSQRKVDNLWDNFKSWIGRHNPTMMSNST
ncbi:hypothetical protein LSAT2_017827 [Lamellibrachia satsuma]|nr:hypothetical protein LSAT2_017827 [Lamellibrachia satsuma]